MELDEEIQTPQVRSSPYQSPIYNYGGSISTLTDPSDELHDMELYFRALVEDSSGKQVRVGIPLMNEQGISSIMGMTRAIVNQITIMGNLDKREIGVMMEYTADTLSKLLMMKRHDFQILAEDRDQIAYKVQSTVYVCMKRPFMEGERRFWGRVQQEITTRIEGKSPNKGLFQRFLGWGK